MSKFGKGKAGKSYPTKTAVVSDVESDGEGNGTIEDTEDVTAPDPAELTKMFPDSRMMRAMARMKSNEAYERMVQLYGCEDRPFYLNRT
jgi:hypothetical protein